MQLSTDGILYFFSTTGEDKLEVHHSYTDFKKESIFLFFCFRIMLLPKQHAYNVSNNKNTLEIGIM